MSEAQRILLVLLLTFVVALLLGRQRIRQGAVPVLRPIAGFNFLRGAMQRAIETGRTVHVALGMGGAHTNSLADSLAGLEVLQSLSERSAAVGVSPIVTVADATLLPMAQDVVRHSGEGGIGGTRRPAPDVRWLSSEPAAYAAGVMRILGAERVEANVMVGAFGGEYLLMGEAADRHRCQHVGGVSDPTVLPLVYATAQHVLVGEDMYAAGAYLARKPWHLASLWAQDVLRWVIVLVIVVSVVVNTVF
jgi:Domain of unknown function (DUF6754)